MHMRQQPHFYLLTRYLVHCSVTGAMHFLRIKNDASLFTQNYIPVNNNTYLFRRLDTPGYLGWYRNFVTASLGYTRLSWASVLQDIKELLSFDELLRT